MAYATQSDIAALYGEELLYQVADRDRDQVLDTEAIARALTSASRQIDTYLSQRYAVPLDEPTEDITRLAVDIGVYRLAQQADSYTKEIRQRYEDAVQQLKWMAEGKIGLGLPPTATPVAGDVREGEALLTGPVRLFTRDHLRGL